MLFSSALLKGVALALFASDTLALPSSGLSPNPNHVLVKNHFQKRGTGINNCFGDMKDTLTAASLDAQDILKYAAERLKRLTEMLESNPVPAYVGMTPADRTLWQTWESFYGQVYFAGPGAPKKNTAALNRVKTMQALADFMHIFLASNLFIDLQIFCDDYFLVDQDWNGNTRTNEYFDIHDLAGGEWVTYSQVTKCAFDTTMTAYTWHPVNAHNNFALRSLIVLCPTSFPAWESDYSSNNRPSRYHNNEQIGTGTWRVDDVWKLLPATLIHEFTHARVLTVGRQNYQDPNSNSGLSDRCINDGRTAYQWECIHKLATESPDQSIDNSDTFSLFTTLLYMNQNDWSTGFSQDLGYIGPRLP